MEDRDVYLLQIADFSALKEQTVNSLHEILSRSNTQIDAVLIFGVNGERNIEPYLRTSFNLEYLMEKIQVPKSQVLIHPSIYDLQCYISFSQFFFHPFMGCHFNLGDYGHIFLPEMTIVGVPADFNLSSSAKDLQSQLEPILTQKTCTKVFVTQQGFSAWWSALPKAIRAYLSELRCFEFTTNARVLVPGIEQSTIQPDSLQVLRYQPVHHRFEVMFRVQMSTTTFSCKQGA
jgi:hypothetical protein